MGTTTSRLGLRKPATGDLVDVETDIAEPYDKLDLYHGLHQCTSGTRPSSPWSGLLIWETDTNRVYFYDGSAWVLLYCAVEDFAAAGFTYETGYSTTYGTIEMYQRGERIYLRGRVRPDTGTVAAGVIKVLTLDAGKRPDTDQHFHCTRWVAGGSPVEKTAIDCILESDGELKCYVPGTTTGMMFSISWRIA